MRNLLIRAALTVAQILCVALLIHLATRLMQQILDARLLRLRGLPSVEFTIFAPELASPKEAD
jgi:hypothetical protein